MQPRTKRQREVLDYITYFIEHHGYEPSYQQIARHFRIASKSAICKHITALETQGLIKRQRENGSFGLQINSEDTLSETVSEIQWLAIPGDGVLPEDSETEPLFVSRFLLGNLAPERLGAFRVRDDAMIEEHVCEGDVALVEMRSFARDGETVVASVEKRKIVLMKIFRRGANVEFRPANPEYAALVVPADKVSIRGILRGILRPAI